MDKPHIDVLTGCWNYTTQGGLPQAGWYLGGIWASSINYIVVYLNPSSHCRYLLRTTYLMLMIWGKIEQWEGRQLPEIETRTPNLYSHCSAIELWQWNNHQPSQFSTCTAYRLYWNASGAHLAAVSNPDPPFHFGGESGFKTNLVAIQYVLSELYYRKLQGLVVVTVIFAGRKSEPLYSTLLKTWLSMKHYLSILVYLFCIQ